MSIERINPKGLYNSVAYGFSHATLQRGGATVHLAGQVSWDADGKLVGEGDLAIQVRQVLANLRAVLESVRCQPQDIIRLRTYVVNHTPDKLGVVLGEVADFFAGSVPPANTYIGVHSLALPEFLV